RGLPPIGCARAPAGRAARCAASVALLAGEIKQPARLEFIADQPFRHLAVAGFRQGLPEEEALWHLVPWHLRGKEAGHFRFGHRVCTLARHADGDANLAPYRIGHAKHRDLADRGMGEDLFLDLARMDVGAAGYVHVRGAAGNVDKTFRIHMAEIAGAKPAVAEGLRVGLRIVIVAGENGRADHADLAGLERFPFLTVIALNRDLHAGALEPATADPRLRSVFEIVQIGWQHRDIAGDLAEAEILHQHPAELAQRRLLVLPVHRRARIDDMAQR